MPSPAPLTSGVYERTDGRWAWRLVVESNGRIVAVDGDQGYENRADAEDMFVAVVSGAFLGAVVRYIATIDDVGRRRDLNNAMAISRRNPRRRG